MIGAVLAQLVAIGVGVAGHWRRNEGSVEGGASFVT